MAIIGPDTSLRHKLVEYFEIAESARSVIVSDPFGKGSDFDKLLEHINAAGSVDTLVVLATALGTQASRWPAIDEILLAGNGVSWANDAQLVVVTSALVYGAWAENPIPLTEKAPAAPNPDLPFASRLVAIEQRGVQWRDSRILEGHKSMTARLAVLRPALVLGDKGRWPDHALAKGMGIPRGYDDPPVQFVYVDDLASAIAFTCENRLDGTFNVASDNWLSGAEVRALAGMPQHLLIPSRLTRFRQNRAASMGGLLSYVTHSWVVANDLLKAAGWVPTFTNEQAFVVMNRGTLWSRLSPKRRQELALIGFVTTLIGLGTALARAVRGWWKH